MQKTQAQNIVRETLQNDFDKERFLYFVKNLLNTIDESKAIPKVAGTYIKEAFRKYINSYERLATYTDPAGSKLDILVVYLQKETSLERARTAQRNFVATYLKNRDQKDAGLVAFVSPDQADWRFSLVKMEYKFTEDKSGKTKVREEFTPAKRWSFLVGKNENSHTAQSRLAPIVEDDQVNPTLKQLEDAFNIEKVTKEFFEKYRELFLRAKESLDELVKNNEKLKQDFEEKFVNTADFTKKLLGQIVFLYFLQKKGWFGVEQGKSWGTGSKSFMRDLFEEKVIPYNNFFNDVLEHLFYDALARDRTDIDHFNPHFSCKIPFLNGGLFDPISNYDWVNTTIDLSNDIFSNTRKTKEGDIGDGILDIFDRYNFTVKEDEPLEKEVAVDPEMLGKVFENLLEVRDRKSKGTYYTPREIVHYMCEQSLVNYLATELEGKVAKEDLEKLIKIGENVAELETVSISKENNPEYGGDYKRILPNSIKEFTSEIDDKLAAIKVCDPAIGSGAFPVGMMNAIVKTRTVLSSYLKGKNRTPYAFKRDCIQNSLYGVDIDPGAVEIAKLRLWLSLVVDEDDIKQIKPLPNLDYKIMQGNSLLEEFEGIKLFDEKLITPIDTNKEKQLELLKQRQAILQKEYLKLHGQNKLTSVKQAELNSEAKKLEDQIKKLSKPEKVNIENVGLFDTYNEARDKADNLKCLHKEFFEVTQKSKKDEIKKQIEQLEWELIEATLKEQGKISALKKLEEFKRSNIKPFFLWKLNFADVFQEKGGFDVVIANPPYKFLSGKGSPIQELLTRGKINEAEILRQELDSVSKKYPRSSLGCKDYYKWFINLGSDLLNNHGIITYITPDTFLTLSKYRDVRSIIFKELQNIKVVDLGFEIFETPVVSSAVFISQKDGKPNNIINYSDLKEINRDDIKNLDFDSIVEGNLLKIDFENGDLLLYKHPLAQKIYECSEFNIKKFVKISEGEHSLQNEFTKIIDKGTVDSIPVIFDSILKKNEVAKIVYLPKSFCPNCNQELHSGNRFFIRKTGDKILTTIPEKYIFAVAHQNLYVAKPINDVDSKFFVGLFSSRLLNFLYQNGIYGQKKRALAQFRIYALYLLPCPNLSETKSISIIDLVENIFAITKTKDYISNSENQAKIRDIELQIDKLVYKLYGLTEDEIKIVEAN